MMKEKENKNLCNSCRKHERVEQKELKVDELTLCYFCNESKQLEYLNMLADMLVDAGNGQGEFDTLVYEREMTLTIGATLDYGYDKKLLAAVDTQQIQQFMEENGIEIEEDEIRELKIRDGGKTIYDYEFDGDCFSATDIIDRVKDDNLSIVDVDNELEFLREELKTAYGHERDRFRKEISELETLKQEGTKQAISWGNGDGWEQLEDKPTRFRYDAYSLWLVQRLKFAYKTID